MKPKINNPPLCACGCGKRVNWNKGGINKWNKFIHGHNPTIHGNSGTPIYNMWNGIINRCNNPKHAAYKDYGGRGIRICNKWKNNFHLFKKWVLSHDYKKGLQIDRKNNNGNYTPENCHFVTPAQNTHNNRHTKLSFEKVREIRKLYNPNKRGHQQELSKIFNIAQSNISQIVNYITWKE